MEKKNIEKLIDKLKEFDEVESYKVDFDKNNVLYHVTGKMYSITLWDKNIGDLRSDLILGSLAVRNPGQGIGTYVLNSLKKYGKDIGYSRLVANKVENRVFLEKMGFVPHELDPYDHYTILK